MLSNLKCHPIYYKVLNCEILNITSGNSDEAPSFLPNNSKLSFSKRKFRESVHNSVVYVFTLKI